jgi:hypothetical protein
LSRANAYTDAIDEPTSHEHANVLRGAHNDATNAPDDSTDLDGSLTTKDIGQLDQVSKESMLSGR